MPKENKSNKATKEARVNKVFELLIAGASRYQIQQYAASAKDGKEDWNLTNRQIDNYIAEANALIAVETEFHREREVSRAKKALDDLYQKSLKVQDYNRALAVRRELNKLMGLYAETDSQTATGQQIVKLVWGNKPERDEDEQTETD